MPLSLYALGVGRHLERALPNQALGVSVKVTEFFFYVPGQKMIQFLLWIAHYLHQ